MSSFASICPRCKPAALAKLYARCNGPIHSKGAVRLISLFNAERRLPSIAAPHLDRSSKRAFTSSSIPRAPSDSEPPSQHIEEDQHNEEDLSHEEEFLMEDLSPEEAFNIARAQLDPEVVAQVARTRFGDRLPEGALTDAEYKIYERMYGTPLKWRPEHEDEHASEVDGLDPPEGTGLLRETADGSLEEVQVLPDEHAEEPTDLSPGAQLQNDIADAYSLEPLEDEEDLSDPDLRTHPYTAFARSGTFPSTLPIPRPSMAGPVSVMLSDVNNKHLLEAAERALGGKGLPYSTGTPLVSRTMPQKPIPLLASHSRMTPMEADVFISTLWPGTYASTTSILVELRRRLGSAWLTKLLSQPEGPRMLDAGGGGASALAWRDLLGAEWARLHDGAAEPPPAPLGKASVLTASAALRHRASVCLTDTTFLPRLPDYIHASADAPRKRFDVIVAPHALWALDEDYMRRQLVDNLWAMLEPDGGVLVLLEKGVPRGFEVVAAARQHLLEDLFAKEGATEDEDRRRVGRAPAAILAPCTTHARCPMHVHAGVSRQRKDYCHFAQRYERPAYLQRLLGASARNHEDVRFSYVAVQRLKQGHGEELGVGEENPTKRLLGERAVERAFEGYDVGDEDLISLPLSAEQHATQEPKKNDAEAAAEQEQTYPPNPFSLPRIVLPPLKRHGHVLLDVCTPAGSLERWTVPKSYGRQAYRDARKARWGDLWAVGAKLRVRRGLRLGKGPEEERLPRKEDSFRGRDKARFRRRMERKQLAKGEE